MDDTTYKFWWKLHLRAACGEHLNREEQETYKAGLKQLHAEEILNEDTEELNEEVERKNLWRQHTAPDLKV